MPNLFNFSAASFKPNVPKPNPFVFVDLSKKAKTANIVRDGFTVPPVELDKNLVDIAVGKLKKVPPRLAPRVISQSVRPGTHVAPGTAVNIVLTPSRELKFKDLFAVPHKSFEALDFATVNEDILEDVAISSVVLKHDNAVDVPDGEREILTAALQQKNVVIDNTDPKATFDKAFEALRSAAAFR